MRRIYHGIGVYLVLALSLGLWALAALAAPAKSAVLPCAEKVEFLEVQLYQPALYGIKNLSADVEIAPIEAIVTSAEFLNFQDTGYGVFVNHEKQEIDIQIRHAHKQAFLEVKEQLKQYLRNDFQFLLPLDLRKLTAALQCEEVKTATGSQLSFFTQDQLKRRVVELHLSTDGILQKVHVLSAPVVDLQYDWIKFPRPSGHNKNFYGQIQQMVGAGTKRPMRKYSFEYQEMAGAVVVKKIVVEDERGKQLNYTFKNIKVNNK